MSSEPEDVNDHLDEPNANSDANVDQSPEEKGNGPREHAKPRRRRRGKKRKQKKESAAACGAANPEECESELHVESEHGDCDSPEWVSDENLRRYYDSFSDVIIRPVDVPKAPLNSTQFIMDDHDDCKFYMSFETPNPYGDLDFPLDREAGDIIEPIGEDAAYIDIDYQYESPQDFDNSAYYDKEFELSYKNNRFEELMRLSRADLIKKLQAYESRLKDISEDLVKENPSPVLEKLQAELLELQEKNSFLKECNTELTAVLENTTDCSEVVTESVSISHNEHESEDSEREVYAECNEVAMSDTETDICDNLHVVEMHNNVEEKYHSSDHLTDQGIDRDQITHFSEDQTSAQSEEATDLQNCHSESSRLMTHTDVSVDDRLCKKMEADTCTSNDTTVINSENKRNKRVHSNSHIMHCQADSLVSDDLRTLNIISSELFHNPNQTKCSSSVPLEGGMSPSETSVN